MKSANFTQCMIDFFTDPSVPPHFHFNDTTKVRASPWSYTSFITREGCNELCGSRPGLYSWDQSSGTINTWVLPILGILLQAPFESNKFWQTVFALARWLGSPMASLAYILWNIKVSGKAALMIDMSLPYNEVLGRDTHFSSMRDSLYILTVMNQFRMNQAIRHIKREAEGLLRFVLFSEDLTIIDAGRTLKLKRDRLAQELRERRKRGVVPVWVSISWFLFSLTVSIQSAFGLLGDNPTAHHLALGLLLAWLPVLVLCSIVDRNPIAADNIEGKLNGLVEDVRLSLQHEWVRKRYYESIANYDQAGELRAWVEQIAKNTASLGPFFVGFAGQGRVRWHYGAAHPILADIESSYIAEHGGDWLRNEVEARTSLVLGRPAESGLTWYDWRELWQVASAVLIVFGTAFGAFILAFSAPTFGLGCTSGGYMIYIVISFSLLVLEMLVWAATSPGETPATVQCCLQALRLHKLHAWLAAAIRTVPDFREKFQHRVKVIVLKMMRIMRFREDSTDSASDRLQSWFRTWNDYDVQQWTERCVLQPIEIINLCWLTYIVIAQTFGTYNTCDCMTSTWAGGGGYIDFNTFFVSIDKSTKDSWIGGTILSCSIMAIGMIYVFLEWCLQSHMSTENYASAQSGLQNTRRFRRATYFYRCLVDTIIRSFKYGRYCLVKLLLKIEVKKGRRSLVWTKNITRLEPHYQPLGDHDPLLQGHSQAPIMPEYNLELRFIVTPPGEATLSDTPRLDHESLSTPGSAVSHAGSRSGGISLDSYFTMERPPAFAHDTAYYAPRGQSSSAPPVQISVGSLSEEQASLSEQHPRSRERHAFSSNETQRRHERYNRPRSTYIRAPSDYVGNGA